MNTRQLQYVIRVAEEQSFSVAAKKLYVSQPSLSELVRNVEKELGYDLFDRAVNPLKLTAAGEVYVETAYKILDLEREMGNRMHDMSETEYGRLSVAMSPYSGLASSGLRQFFDVFPNYNVEFHDSVTGTTERLKLLEQGRVDLCIQPITSTFSSKFVVEEVSKDDLVLVVPTEFAVNNVLQSKSTNGLPLPIVDLDVLRVLHKTPFVLAENGMRLRKNINDLFEQAGIEPNVKVVCHKSEGCLNLAMAGIGATIVQYSLVKWMGLRNMVQCYSIHQDFAADTIAAIYIRNRYFSKAMRVFVDILKTL